MARELFDDYSRNYQEEVQRAVNFTFQDAQAFTRVKVELLLAQVAQHVGSPSNLAVLDVGCGVGLTDRGLIPVFDRVVGVDVSEESLRIAKASNPGADYHQGTGEALPFADATFDVVFAMCVLHHVPPQDWPAVVAEMGRVTRPDGLIVVFEHNPWNPLTRLAVARCPFDADARLLSMAATRTLYRRAGLPVVAARYFLFTPWAATALGNQVDRAFGWLPLGGQYLVAGRPARGRGVNLAA